MLSFQRTTEDRPLDVSGTVPATLFMADAVLPVPTPNLILKLLPESFHSTSEYFSM